MPSSTVEDYVKSIYTLQQGLARDELVPLGRVAGLLGVVPGTATTMMKTLSEAGLVRYEMRAGARLTAQGEKLALHVLRRHRLIELFLVKVLGFDWADVHEEAERLEHAMSDKLVEKIDAYLGRPAYDPHGDPIPSAAGKIQRRVLLVLPESPVNEAVVLARLSDQDPTFLAYATSMGLVPGKRLRVEQVDEIGGTVVLRLDHGGKMSLPLSLGFSAARKVYVERLNGERRG